MDTCSSILVYRDWKKLEDKDEIRIIVEWGGLDKRFGCFNPRVYDFTSFLSTPPILSIPSIT